MEELVIIALRIMEKQARHLRLKVQKNQKFGWEEVKPIVIASGELLDRKDVKDELRKIMFLLVVPLEWFIDWTMKLKIKDKAKDGSK